MEITLSSKSKSETKSTEDSSKRNSLIRYKTIRINDVNIFYREAGTEGKPSVLLLHGFPSSSHMFRNLLNALGHKYHLIAPDYPGFGYSSMPPVKDFGYSFDHLASIIDKFIAAIHLDKYSLYMMDYGAPVGFRIAMKHPEKVQALLVQNGNAYEEGLSPFWDHMREYWREPEKQSNINFIKSLLTPEGTKSQYTNGVRNPDAISPDSWTMDQTGLDRPGNEDIQLQLFYSYKTNVAQYPQWQEYLRKNQPPTLITWGKNDTIFPATGAEAYKKDLKKVEIHLLNTGHFALEEDGDFIATLIDQFMVKNKIK